VVQRAEAAGERVDGTGAGWIVPQGILAMVAASLAVYTALFAIGNWLYGRVALAAALSIVAVGGAAYVVRVWERVSGRAVGAMHTGR
jgi:solute:Na+ symporter, SSS family